ncbi:aspartate carbamoyltransferase [Candidatus Micrarchaeota archaeon]|nr:aspartate carbamoyltransferase [Candidatus Micrarchaeota archaeon]
MDLLSVKDLDKRSVESIHSTADDILEKRTEPDLMGKILGTLFFEPSTRTKMSFQSAALRSKMQILDFNPEGSSLKKGESFSDTIRMVSAYSDVLAIRHSKEGAAKLAAEVSEIPVINCGDGGNQHPTQALIDTFTMRQFKGRLSNLEITLLGDLKHARAMRSLLWLLGMMGANVTMCAPEGLEMDKEYVSEIKKKFSAKISLTDEPNYTNSDVLYMCRIQQERFSDPYLAKTISEKFSLTKEALKDADEDLIILHPLPRLSELPEEVDLLPQAKYFEQAKFAVPIRQAVLKYILEG